MVKKVLKIAGVVLVLYSLIITLSTPLTPGVVDFEPARLDSGWNQVSFRFFPNVHGNKPSHFYLKSEASFLPITGDISSNQFTGKVWVPDTLPKAFVHLVGQIGNSEMLYLDGASFAMHTTEGLWPTASPDWAEVHDPGMVFPFKTILYQTIRNLNLHVPMWFAMMAIMMVSLIFSIRFLNTGNVHFDLRAKEAATVGLFFSIIGILTGAVWAKFTWGNWWVNDPKLNGAAVSTLVYLAYFVLRGSVKDDFKKGKLSGVYNIFAFIMMLVFIMVLPRLTDSLHPGNGGNPAFSQYDLDNNLRKAFYPAVLGWILMGIWISEVKGRVAVLRYNLDNEE